jgi:CheY-like chemotaxis protein
MPSSNGYTVLEYLQRNNRFDGVPVVAYTTHISHLNDAKRAGFHSFLGKPIDGRNFAKNLEKILKGQAVWEIPE